MYRKACTLYGFHDADGGIAAAICLRHLRESGAEFYDFHIAPVARPKKHVRCLSNFLRTHHKIFNISRRLIQDYDDMIDFAEIIHNNLFASERSSEDSNSPAVKLRTLFHACSSIIDQSELYKRLVYKLSENPSIEDFFDSDAMFGKIIECEMRLA